MLIGVAFVCTIKHKTYTKMHLKLLLLFAACTARAQRYYQYSAALVEGRVSIFIEVACLSHLFINFTHASVLCTDF